MALPVYEDWPRFPQVWVNGELIGSGDIVSELHQSGELKVIISAAVKSADLQRVMSEVV